MATAPYNRLRFLVEDMILDYVRATDDPGPNVTFARTADVVAFADLLGLGEPLVTIACTGTRPFPDTADASQGVQNRECDIAITIRTHAEDQALSGDPAGVVATARDAHMDLVARVLDLFEVTNLVTLLNARPVPGIGVDQVDRPSETFAPAEHSYETVLTFAVLCHPTDS